MTKTKWTINAIKNAMRAAGSHWWDPDTMRFFGTRVVGSRVYNGENGVYFITSEWDGFSGRENNRRAYTIRKYLPDTCDVKTIGDIGQYRDADDAKNEVLRIAGKGDSNIEQFEPVSELEQFIYDCRKHGHSATTPDNAAALIALGARWKQDRIDSCNIADHKEAKGLRSKIRKAAAAVGAVSVILDGDPRGCTVKLVWANGETNDFGKDGWCVPNA